MAICKSCDKSGANYIHYDGGKICEKCVGHYFTCPDCGIIFDRDDRVHGDQGNGFCWECAAEH